MLPKPEFVRVKDKNSKGEYTVASYAVRDHHEVLKNKDAVDVTGRPLPPKPFVPHKGASKKSSAPAASQSTPEAPAESKEG